MGAQEATLTVTLRKTTKQNPSRCSAASAVLNDISWPQVQPCILPPHKTLINLPLSPGTKVRRLPICLSDIKKTADRASGRGRLLGGRGGGAGVGMKGTRIRDRLENSLGNSTELPLRNIPSPQPQSGVP